jgi:site-specific recombinase XerD
MMFDMAWSKFGQQVSKLTFALFIADFTSTRQMQINDFRFHDLRHSAATNLLQAGATLHQVAEILEHRDLRMAQRYAHLTDDSKLNVMENADKIRPFGQDLVKSTKKGKRASR